MTETIEEYDKKYIQKILRDPAANDNNGIIWACENGNLGLVSRLLQDSRVNPAARNGMALFWAAYRGYLDIVELLVKDGRINISGVIAMATRENHPNVVKILSNYL